ncbi:MAG: polysaccharide deacetylase family protein [Caulobacteraceae bacterium]
MVKAGRTWRLGPAIAVALLASVGFARAEPVALTFDDLPTLALTSSTPYARITTERLLGRLRRHRLPATGFVNEGKLEGADRTQRIALLSDWLNAGMDLGNHGYSHESLNRTPVQAYIGDVSRGETVTRALLAARGRRPRWFRHPYLETGATQDIRRTFEDWLAAHGYRVAPVSLENADWMFALPYDDAILRRDRAAAERVQQAYLTYTAKVVPWYRTAALGLLGRRPAFVMLLHASRLNADSMDQIAAILRANHLRGVTLARAMTDPAYGIKDTYVGPDGEEWLSRWSLALNKSLPWSSFPEPPVDIAAESDRLDDEPSPASRSISAK